MGAIYVKHITKSTKGEVFKLINLKKMLFLYHNFQMIPRNKEAIGMIGRRRTI